MASQGIKFYIKRDISGSSGMWPLTLKMLNTWQWGSYRAIPGTVH